MTRPRVALIGCGASGMCFLHALVTRQKREGNVVNFPYVVCFEQANEPGGCWRAPEDREQPHNQACWHEDVWNNVCKEGFEFADYTFQEHFGKAVPTFLPRALLLDYLRKRTESLDPNLYQTGEGKPSATPKLHEVRFNTAVKKVKFDSDKQQFEIQSQHCGTSGEADGDLTTEYFDYCIWAGGLRGKPRIPRFTLNLLRTGGDVDEDESLTDETRPTPFTGKVLHSIHCSAANTLDEAVRDKRIVLIGDSNSAEELALQSVRHGVKKCHVLSRSGFGDCFYMGSWPGDKDPETGKIEPKVEVHLVLPRRIVGDGKTIKCSPMEWNDEIDVYEFDNTGESVTLTDIDTIIICTGYVPNMDFMSEELNIHSEQLHSWYWSVPEDFKMKENEFTPEIGEIKPSSELSFSGNVLPGVYRTVLMNNPRMMYIMDNQSEYPLLQLEALAWLTLGFIVGEVDIPDKEQMEQYNLERLIEEMHIAYLRWSLDDNYFQALDELPDDHWSDDYDDPRAINCNKELLAHHAGTLARDFNDANYPIEFGSYGALNEKGENLVEIGLQNIIMRHLLDKSSDEATWKTYRDVDPSPLRSIYTGQVPTPLPRPWLEMQAEDVLDSDS